MVERRMRLVIGEKHWSSWSLRPWIAMRRLGIAFEEVVVRLRRPDTAAEILRLSPSGKVPALIDGDQVIWDSLAILETLAEQHPRLWPESRAARAHARSISAEMHSGFQALRHHCPMEFLARVPKADLAVEAKADVRRVVAIWREARGRYGRGGPFLYGAFSAADAMYAPVVSRFATYLPDLEPYGDDGTAASYVAMMMATPEMTAWGEGAKAET
jgi:glutathione S-transferase